MDCGADLYEALMFMTGWFTGFAIVGGAVLVYWWLGERRNA